MKITLSTIIIFLLFCLTGCSDKKDEAIVVTPIPLPSQSAVAGKIAVAFKEAVTENEAVKLIEDFKLTIFSKYGFGALGPHNMVIIVKEGEEQKWIDILKAYPQVESAGRLMVTFLE